ncbi:MAG: Fe-S protein assembly co-chaperone HscB [Acidobacteriota bacterium]
MQPDTSAVTIQPCKHCGSQAPVDVHFCPRCDRILTLGRHGDYFRFFGLPRRLQIDERDLEQRFRAFSRQFHPDYFYNSSSTERLASLERSSYLNDAFRTLRGPVERLEYLLKLEGFAPKETHEATTQVPPQLLEEVFELNEQLETIQQLRADGAPEAEVVARLEAARTPIQANLDAHERQLNALMRQHDADVDRVDHRARHETLGALRALLIERTYLTNLIATVRREMGSDQAARA